MWFFFSFLFFFFCALCGNSVVSNAKSKWTGEIITRILSLCTRSSFWQFSVGNQTLIWADSAKSHAYTASKIHQSLLSIMWASIILWGSTSSYWKSLIDTSIRTQMVKSGPFWLCRQPDEMFVLLPDLYSLKEFTAATWLYAVRSVMAGLASSLSNLEMPALFFLFFLQEEGEANSLRESNIFERNKMFRLVLGSRRLISAGGDYLKPQGI